MDVPYFPVAIVGAGQAGLSLSRELSDRGIEHIVFERDRVGHAWRNERWDTFCLVTPNWQCRLPGYPYAGDDPDGFMARDEIVAYLQGFAASFSPPLREGVAVRDVRPGTGGTFELETSGGACRAEAVVAAVGGYHTPIVPAFARFLPERLLQLHSQHYRNPAAVAGRGARRRNGPVRRSDRGGLAPRRPARSALRRRRAARRAALSRP